MVYLPSYIDVFLCGVKLEEKKLRSRRLLFRRYANSSATSQGNRYEVSRESINLTCDACSSDPESSIRSEQFGVPIGPATLLFDRVSAAVLVRRSASGASVVEFIDSLHFQMRKIKDALLRYTRWKSCQLLERVSLDEG